MPTEFLIKRQPLRIFLVKWGRGVFYHYTTKQSKIFPVIAMNSDMLECDPELFAWVFEHELEHYKFYSDFENFNTKNSIMSEIGRLLTNPKMTLKLNKFELSHPESQVSRYEEINKELDML